MRAPEFWTSSTLASRAAAWALSPLGNLYDWGGRIKQWRTQPQRLPARVLCVGNLTVGGTGKTPVALAIGALLAKRQEPFAFLSRGYRGTLSQPAIVDPARHSASEVGDEPLLLARHGMTVVSADRVAGAWIAVQHGARTIIMDDGFQNPGLVKDVSLIVVDTHSHFGNGFVIPAGPLREPIARGLARAQGVVLMGDGASIATSLPQLRVSIVPSAEAQASVEGKKVAAFAGIGRPEKFFATLKAAGAQVVLAHAFADHYAFQASDWRALREEAVEYGATLVTTEKDWVRLEAAWRAEVMAFPVEAQFEDTPALEQLLGLS
ncbi:MAG TPA: tetraacyldisaccharide 4'-kinase [Alphaproteobacteria bacterium]|nr:tetraacyldisaccharide 4'-kinase [Alphaproteobacteria bacterium]